VSAAGAHIAIEAAYRGEARRVLATLIRLLGGFDVAEEALHEAFAAAARQWPREGVPDNPYAWLVSADPYAWLVSAGRFKTIDRWRREKRLDGALPELAALTEPAPEPAMREAVEDDELRLIFICCHPVLTPDARIALTLREVAGLTTEEIARAYLTSAPTIAQRIVRAKAKIRDEAIAYEIPAAVELAKRLESVLQVIYLVFNEGYAATQGPDLTRTDLCVEAVRLARLLVALLDDPEAQGLLALMLMHEARRATRSDAAGDLVLLEDQDRSLWDRGLIAEAQGLIERAFASRRIGPYVLQAAIACAHATAASFGETDWSRIVSLYDVLARVDPSPVVALNRAAALAMRDGPEAGLAAIDATMSSGALDLYHLAHSARADMQRRLGLIEAADASYRRALALTQQPAERRFLEERIEELVAKDDVRGTTENGHSAPA
jgi:RNA polymerase sigma-70 factor (ECF subfamily)